MNKTVTIAATLLLAACAGRGIPQQAADWQAQREWKHFSASGRLGVKVQDKGSYANFDWLREYGVETIDVNTPLGNTVGQLCRDGKGVLAQNSRGQVFHAATAEELSKQLLGHSLPLQHLLTWANGEWASTEPHQVSSDGVLQQSGWRISRERSADGSPRLLLLENAQMSLRLVFGNVYREVGQPEKQALCGLRDEESSSMVISN